MPAGLSISVTETDPEYLGVEIRGWTNRYCGTTFVFAAPGELTAAARSLEGFPSNADDERHFELGSSNERMASGHCHVRVSQSDALGHLIVDVELIECDLRFPAASAAFQFRSEPGLIDGFASQLSALEAARHGLAELGMSG